jgi:predicted ATP-dependent endonuclease of OLD family
MVVNVKNGTDLPDFGFRVHSVSIKQFKGIEELDIEFPLPEIMGDPDTFAIGSSNGIGKTTILEAITLGLFLFRFGDQVISKMFLEERPSGIMDLARLLIRSNSRKSEIGITIESNRKLDRIEFVISENGIEKRKKSDLRTASRKNGSGKMGLDKTTCSRFIDSWLGFSPDPVVFPQTLYFHSYRKIKEGQLRLDTFAPTTDIPEEGTGLLIEKEYASFFKSVVTHALIAKGNVFENIDVTESEMLLNQLNVFVKEYANGAINKLRSMKDGSMEIQISPSTGFSSFPFDGLSSGQKEIISTLFLIWDSTRRQPGVVLIDEPELHLNPEWAIKLVWILNKIAPKNQYILSTHSEDVFGSVRRDHRLLLTKVN